MQLKEKKGLRPKERAVRLGLTSDRFTYNDMSESAEDEISYAKRKDRTYLKRKQWERQRFFWTDATEQLFSCPDQIDRVDVDELTVEGFVDKYQRPGKPVIIKGITRNWNPQKYWTFQAFYDRYKDVKFKVGEDDDGHKIRTKLKYYLEYVVHNTDDSPLYLFESSLESRPEMQSIIEHYKVPKYFKDDILKYAGESKRPPYRWLLIGPQRSGTTVHIDPLYTSAWNTSLAGHKRWVLFPESVPKGVVKGYKHNLQQNQIEAINYFTKILPKIIEEQPKELLGTIEFIQYPGETVFVPGGWWHAVINLDDTFAVTQNVMTHTNFQRVWASMRKERRKFACKFLQVLKRENQALYNRAIFANERDGWRMGFKQQRRASMSYVYDESSSSSSSSDEDTHSRSRSRNRSKRTM